MIPIYWFEHCRVCSEAGAMAERQMALFVSLMLTPPWAYPFLSTIRAIRADPER